MNDKKCCSSENTGHPIKGISCDVKNCVHHDGESCCMAKEITVGPSYATSSSDTVCATFKPNDTCCKN